MKSTFFSLMVILTVVICEAQSEPKPIDGLQFINDKFLEFSIVGIGESHALSEQYEFLKKLMGDKTFQNSVKNIVVEFGNIMYQPILDAYVVGKEIEFNELQKVWMNTTQSPVDPWSSIVYYDFITHVRNINQELNNEDKIRIIAADPPIEWERVDSFDDYKKYMTRNTTFANTVIEEVLKKKEKALLIVGGAHLSNVFIPSPITKSESINMQIEKEYPNSTFIIQTICGFGKYTEEYEPKLIQFPKESIFTIKNTWLGKIPAPMMITPVSSNSENQPKKGFIREDIYDAMLYLGSLKTLNWISADKKIYEDDELWNELNRRSIIRFNHPLIPESRFMGQIRPVKYN